MAVDLVAPIEAFAAQVERVELARVGADAGAEVLRRATESVLGGDLTMSGLNAGPVEFDTSRTTGGHVEMVGVGATFGLADGGRQRRVTATARRRSALDTPWGPRAYAAGSTWSGFGIIDRYGDEALAAASNAVVAELEWGN